jgi:hypothetical protein
MVYENRRNTKLNNVVIIIMTYYEKNKEKILNDVSQYYKLNKDFIKDYNSNYYQKNRIKLLKKRRLGYYQKNKIRIKQQLKIIKDYGKNYMDKVYYDILLNKYIIKNLS